MKPVRLGSFAFVLALSIASIVPAAPVPPGAKETPETELAKLVGQWKVTSRTAAGTETVAAAGQETILIFKKEGVFTWEGTGEDMGKIAKIDPSKNPKEIDYLFTAGAYKGQTQKGFYKFEGDTFTDCCSPVGDARPTEFKSSKENGYEIMVAKRVKQKD